MFAAYDLLPVWGYWFCGDNHGRKAVEQMQKNTIKARRSHGKSGGALSDRMISFEGTM